MLIAKKDPLLKIANRSISLADRPLVIVEIGINHGGSLLVAKKMVDAAQRSGAEVIKHQTHILEDEMTDLAKTVIPGNAKESIYEIMRKCLLSEEDELELKRYVESKGLIFISTPFSRAAADRLERFGVPAYKIGSGECNNYPLIEHIAKFGKPIILSTGMNDLASVGRAVDIFRRAGVPFALMHCTNVYPTPPELVRLGGMVELGQCFPDAIIGLSDHSMSNFPCLGAVALGACILERHFTDTMSRVGPDICCSMDPEALAELIRGSEIIAKSRGGNKCAVLEEQPCIDFAFSSVVSIARIQKGEPLSRANLWVKRPGIGGIPAEEYDSMLGKFATRDIEAGQHLDRSDFQE